MNILPSVNEHTVQTYRRRTIWNRVVHTGKWKQEAMRDVVHTEGWVRGLGVEGEKFAWTSGQTGSAVVVNEYEKGAVSRAVDNWIQKRCRYETPWKRHLRERITVLLGCVNFSGRFVGLTLEGELVCSSCFDSLSRKISTRYLVAKMGGEEAAEIW